MTNAKALLLAATGVIALGMSGQALARNAVLGPSSSEEGVLSPLADDQADAATPGVGDIIVTARKRQESILKVPVIQSVLTSDQLERSQVTDLGDIASMTPGVVLGVTSLETGTQISIRGVGTSATDPGIDQSVSLNLDGLQLSHGLAYAVGVFDMAQVEVLKGPQALFFGKNSPAGVIAIRTADPGTEAEVVARTGMEFTANEWRSEVIVSGPLTETLGLRVAGMYSDFGGYFRNRATPLAGGGGVQADEDFGRAKTLYLRGTAVWRPTDRFNARLKLNYTRDRVRDGTAYSPVSCPDGIGPTVGIQFMNPNEECGQNRTLYVVNLDPAAFPGVFNNGQPFSNTTQKFGTLEMNYDLDPDLTLTSVTGYYKLNTRAMINGTYSGYAASSIAAQKVFSRREFTEELRLASDFAGPLNFTLGGFYQNARMRNFIQILGNQALGFPLPPLILEGTHDLKIESLSMFGQLRYQLTPTFELSGGVRWTREERNDRAGFTDVFGAVGPAGAEVVVPQPRLLSKNWSPEVTLTYTPTDDLTIFGSLKQGYKSGSYNLLVPISPGQDASFGDEKVQGGEIGLKARLADRQVFANLAAYYYKYDGLQVGSLDTSGSSGSVGVPLFRTLNAGSAKVYGVDFDVNFRPSTMPGLHLRAAVNWNKAEFTSFEGAQCWGGQRIVDGCNQTPNPTALDPDTGLPLFTAQSLTGSDLPRAPRWQGNVGFTYEMEMPRDLTLSFGGDVQYSSKYLTTLGRRADFYQAGFAKLNANVTVRGQGNAWEVALIGTNLTDKMTSGACTNIDFAGSNAGGIRTGGVGRSFGGVDEVACYLGRGRELWVRLTLRPTAFR